MEVLNQNLIVKSNRLIEAGYKLTLQEQRIILLCITKIKPKEQLTSKTFCISADEYAERFGIKVNNAYKELKQIIDTLYNRNVKIYNKEANIEGEFRWVQKKLYFNNEGYAEITLTDDLLPLLSELKSAFTSYNLDHVAGMKSIYAIRMYELFKQFSSFSRRRIELDWLKMRLQIEDLYPAFADLKRRVIDPASKEINEHSDLNVTYKLFKKGKKVIALDFEFYKKRINYSHHEVIENTLNVNFTLLNKLKKFGLTEKQTLEILEKYDEERIQKAIDLTSYNIEMKQIKKSVVGFLIRAIEEEYVSYEINQRNNNKLKLEKKAKIELLKIKIEESNSFYKKYISSFIDNKIKEFALDVDEIHIDSFLKQSSETLLKAYKKNGFSSKMVYSMFVNFTKNKFENQLLTEQDFYKEKGIDIESLRNELQSVMS